MVPLFAVVGLVVPLPICSHQCTPALASHPRCPPLIAKASGPDEEWSPSDDSMLAEHIAMRAASARCGEPERVLSGLNEAWVLIFNMGKQDEGVYTLQGQQSRASAYVLAFEYTDDANRFATLLQAEGFDLATPARWNVGQFSALCDAGEFEVSLVPQGALITPPTKNEYDVDAFDKYSGNDGLGLDAYATQRAAFERLYLEGM
jgi:hypothetical protein